MSILIKGMKKPDCYICPFAHDGWPDEWEMHCLLLDRQVGHFGKKLKKPKDCPIVEVPTPHGRLIDADEAHIDADERGFDFWACDADIDSAQEFLKAQPTIIEAEEGAEECLTT